MRIHFNVRSVLIAAVVVSAAGCGSQDSAVTPEQAAEREKDVADRELKARAAERGQPKN